MDKEELKEKVDKIYNTLMDMDAELGILELTTIDKVVELSGEARDDICKATRKIEEIIRRLN